ncbi:MAG: mechanosensitive ion channel [Sphingomonadales bacterium]|nr:mechanosensitive ion channel [Sphingomonadales bacterium]
MTNAGYRYEFDWELAQAWGTKLLIILAILVVTWALAKAAKWAIEKIAEALPVLQRHDGTGQTVASSLGTIAALLIWLVGLVAVLQRLGLDEALLPLQSMLNQIATAIPAIVVAGLVFALGVILARIVRRLVVTALTAINLDGWAARGGVDNVVATSNISRIIGTICYAVIIIFFAIMALGILDIPVISDPLTRMLELIFAAIPRVIGAALLLGIGYMIARWVSEMLEALLVDMGFDRAMHGMSLLPADRSPARLVGKITMIAIMISFAIAATRLLGFPELTQILDEVLAIGGNIVFGVAIIAVGFLVANLLASLVAGATEGGQLAVNVVRYATIGLFIVMGLAQMGLGGPIVEIGFTAIAIGVGVAIALAFGLGGRDEAARILRDARDKADAMPSGSAAVVERRVPPRKTPAARKSPPQG